MQYTMYSLAVHGPVIWNQMPHDLWSTDISLTNLRKRLKTFLFDADTQQRICGIYICYSK